MSVSTSVRIRFSTTACALSVFSFQFILIFCILHTHFAQMSLVVGLDGTYRPGNEPLYAQINREQKRHQRTRNDDPHGGDLWDTESGKTTQQKRFFSKVILIFWFLVDFMVPHRTHHHHHHRQASWSKAPHICSRPKFPPHVH